MSSGYDPTIMTAATMTAEQMAERLAAPAAVGTARDGVWRVDNVPAEDPVSVASRLAALSRDHEVLFIHAFTTNPWTTTTGGQVVPQGAKPVVQIISIRRGGRANG